LALWRCQHVVWRPSNGNSNFTGRLNRRHGALLLTFIWTYTLVVTCPPLFGWGRYDREAAHIRYLTISQMNFQVEQFSNISLHICQLFSELGIENEQQSILHSLHVRHGIVYSTVGHLHLLHQHSNLHSQGY
jgi:hypothetical protein